MILILLNLLMHCQPQNQTEPLQQCISYTTHIKRQLLRNTYNKMILLSTPYIEIILRAVSLGAVVLVLDLLLKILIQIIVAYSVRGSITLLLTFGLTG